MLTWDSPFHLFCLKYGQLQGMPAAAARALHLGGSGGWDFDQKVCLFCMWTWIIHELHWKATKHPPPSPSPHHGRINRYSTDPFPNLLLAEEILCNEPSQTYFDPLRGNTLGVFLMDSIIPLFSFSHCGGFHMCTLIQASRALLTTDQKEGLKCSYTAIQGRFMKRTIIHTAFFRPELLLFFW